MKKAKRILAGALAALILTMSLPLSALADEADVPVESPSFEVSFDVDTGQEEISEDPPADIEATPEPTPEPTAEPTQEPTPTPESTATPTPTAEPTAAPTAAPEVTATPTSTPEPSVAASPTPSAAPSASPAAKPTPTPSPQPVTNPIKLEHEVLTDYETGGLYLFPVPDGDEITQEYSEQHKAWDIAAVTGSAVVAAEEGTVTYVQIWDGSYDTTGMMSYGHMIRIEHPDGNTTLYAHLSEINVQQGEKVVRGQRIGRVGSTGNSTGPHLHFEVMSETGKKENPEPVLEYGVSTLLDDYTWSWVNQYLNRPNGTKTISDYGVTRDKVVAELTSHQSDNYYLGTTYVGGDSQSPKGDTSYNGSVGMNCAGFVSYVLCKLGLNAGTSDLNNHTALPANSVQGLMTKAVGGRSADWYSSYKSRNLLAGASNYCFWIANGDLKSYAFQSKSDMLSSGVLEKGDIILMLPTTASASDRDTHIGFFWGNSSSEDNMWHSFGSNNHISTITPKTSPSYYVVIKYAPSEYTLTLNKTSSNPSLTNNNSNYSLSGAVYEVYGNKTTYTTSTVTYYTVNASGGLNLRSSANTSSSVLITMTNGASVKYLSTSGSWYRVEYTHSNGTTYEVLGGTTRTGANSASSALGNGQASNGYAIKGVEYTYLKIADITQFTESEKDGGRTDSHIEVLYAIDKVKGADMLAAIGLADGKNSYENANALDANNWYYQSDVLSAALKAALEANSTTVKNSLEAYVKNNGGTAMTETNEDGYSNVTGLPVGLYLLVETRTPEMVTGTTNPCFVSLPMTTVDGGMADGSGNQITTGGQDWNYNVVLYPKNETGIVTLEKTVREAVKDTGKNNATDVITDGFTHNATASAGDTIEYQIISTLPTITSAATNISAYTFQDVLARGLSYVGGTNSVTLEFFTDANCTNKVTTWKQSDGKFKVTREENNDGTHTMTISMTDDGLAEINTANTAYDNDNGKLYAGYSNYTLRIRYDAKLNSDESLVYGDNGNKNEVVLTWKRTNDTYYDTLIDDAHIYTYATNITKTFSDGKEEQTMFDNVLFKAQNASDGYYVIAQLNEDEGIWYVTGHTDKEASATAMHPVEWNGKKGQIILKGVEDDQYIWTELETANGYTLLKNNIDVTIKSVDDANRPCDIYGKDTLGVIQNDPRYNFPNNEDYKLANIPQKKLAHNYQTASATVDGNDVTMLDDEMDAGSKNAIAPLQVVNTRGFETPMTGENGTWALAIGGVLVFCLGTSAFIFFLVFKKRKEQEDK